MQIALGIQVTVYTIEIISKWPVGIVADRAEAVVTQGVIVGRIDRLGEIQP